MRLIGFIGIAIIVLGIRAIATGRLELSPKKTIEGAKAKTFGWATVALGAVIAGIGAWGELYRIS